MFVYKVLSREALHKLRWCKTTHPVLSGALWMPIGRFSTILSVDFLVLFLCISTQKNLIRFDLALRTDRPVVGRPHAWSLPTIYRFGSHLLQCSDFFCISLDTWVFSTWTLPTIYRFAKNEKCCHRWKDIVRGTQLGRRLFGPPHTGGKFWSPAHRCKSG